MYPIFIALLISSIKLWEYNEIGERLSPKEIQDVERINKILVQSSPDKTGSSDNLIFGIICLEMDDSMTSIAANVFNINIHSK